MTDNTKRAPGVQLSSFTIAHRRILAGLTWLLVLTSLAGAITAVASESPVLGQSWGPNQSGYGERAPKRVFNGGDPTGLLQSIHWRSWGRKRAVGFGVGSFTWPGYSVADGIMAKAKIIVYRFGQCSGQPSYNAVQWFFPEYGQHFHPNVYIDACNGDYHGFSTRSRECGEVTLARQNLYALDIYTSRMPCGAARRVIKGSARRISHVTFSGHSGKFKYGKYYCGSEGWGEGSPPVLFSCAADLRSFSVDIYPPAD